MRYIQAFSYFRHMNMKDLIASFPEQLEEALSIAKASQLPAARNEIRNVVIGGLGGSGIGGTIVSQLVKDECPVPVVSCKDYVLPAFADEYTLFIACSYSGNTEETLMSLGEAVASGAMVVGITSGGKLQEICEENGFGLITIPGGNPPRACLAYSLVQLIHVFRHHGLFEIDLEAEVRNFLAIRSQYEQDIDKKATEIAAFLNEGVPVLYGEERNEGVVVRLRQQINENAKALCWHHIVPEMNHNELVGWAGGDDRFRALVLRSSMDHPRSATRMDIARKIIPDHSPYIELEAKGETRLVQFLYFINVGDWVSWHMSELREVDAVEVKVIDYLKGELARH